MSWSNSSHSSAIQKNAVGIQVTTAGTAELTADVSPGHSSLGLMKGPTLLKW